MQRLLWEKVMTKTDAQRQNGNQTGDLRLTKANFLDEGNLIDHTRYFRYDIFKLQNWEIVDKDSMKEKCEVKFIISVDNGRFEGKTRLTVAHKPKGEAGQRNYTTGIRWGSWLSHILINEINCTGWKVSIMQNNSEYFLSINQIGH